MFHIRAGRFVLCCKAVVSGVSVTNSVDFFDDWFSAGMCRGAVRLFRAFVAFGENRLRKSL